MKKIYLVLLIALYGCSPAIRAYYDYDKADPVQKYKTFSWELEMKVKPLYFNGLADSEIKSAANDLMRMKGYLLTDQEADLSLNYHIEIEERSIFWPDADGYFMEITS